MLKTLKLAVVALFLTFITVPAITLAVDVTGDACKEISNSAVCKGAQQGSVSNPLFGENGVLTRVVSILSLVIGVIAVIVIFVSGIRFAVSQGDSQKVINARNTIIYSAVGLAVAVMAQAIVQFVLAKL